MDGGFQGRRHRTPIADGENGGLIMIMNAPVGIIGLGLIGIALSERLIDAKVPVIGFDIEATGCDKLKAIGGAIAASVRDLAGRSRAIVVAVYSGEQVEAASSAARARRGPS
jgi:3-hydroxyisobutyrate dehydrogenase-like beta-hydroxyacid dehydrogenase